MDGVLPTQTELDLNVSLTQMNHTTRVSPLGPAPFQMCHFLRSQSASLQSSPTLSPLAWSANWSFLLNSSAEQDFWGKI